MISSVIAKLNRQSPSLSQTIHQIAQRSGLEIGELVDHRLLPLTIDLPGNVETENTTRWLQSLPDVEFVDVVFVHFEE